MNKIHWRWLLLIILGLAVYARTFGYKFIFDDYDFIVNNYYITSFDHVHYIWNSFPRTRTIGIYSFAFNYLINQSHPQGYHIFNFVVHLLAVGLVWATATLLFKIVKSAPGELPFVIALLFLVHPCQTQAVTYISQRFESMATVFYLGSIYSYLCARISSSKKHKILLFACCAGFAILGIMTKEVAATIPFMILAVELIFFKGNRRRTIFLMVGGLLFFMLFMKLVRADLSIFFNFYAPSESHDGDIITVGKYILTQMRVLLTFLRLFILPVNQNIDYDYPLSTGLLSPPLTLAGLCVIGLMTFLIFRLRKGWPLISFGLAWILITFSINTAPRANVIFEHKLYLISFGFFLAFVCTLSMIIKDRKILRGILITLIAVLSLVSFKRNQVWQNEITLWSDAARKSPHKARPNYNLGLAYYKSGNFRQALLDYNKAIDIKPGYLEAYINRGIVYDDTGNFTQALSDDNKAIQINPQVSESYFNRGLSFSKQGNLNQAISDFTKAIELNPDYAEGYINRGSIYEIQGNLTQALSNYNKAIQLYPPVALPTDNDIWLGRINTISIGNVLKSNYTSYADAYYNRGCVYDKQGNLTGALSDYNTAIEINPDYANAYNNRGYIYSRQGNFSQAISDFNKAIGINPNVAGYYYNRAISYYGSKDYLKALADAHRAQDLGYAVNPEFLSALNKVL